MTFLPTRALQQPTPEAPGTDTDLMLAVERLGPLGSPGLASRAWPFIGILAFVFALGPVGAVSFDLRLWLVALGMLVGLCVASTSIPWGRLPVWTQQVIPLSMFAVLLVLREATGGAASGIAASIVPILWLALYGSARSIGVAVGLIVAVYMGPLLVWDRPVELEARRALTSAVINGALAWTVFRLVGVLRDTRRQLAGALERERDTVDQLRELDRLKDRFVAMASHELRTPVTSVYGFAETILTRWDDLDERQRLEYLGIVERESSRLANLVDDLLVLSRMQQGKLQPHYSDVGVRDAITEAVNLSAIDGVEVSCDDGVRLLADPLQLQRMLVNYLSNARKYGEAPIEVNATVQDEWVELRVLDHGTGVRDSFVPRLFDEFERDIDNPSAAGTGHGLGLSIVRGLALAHGGNAWFEPNEPQGAVFALRLPREHD